MSIRTHYEALGLSPTALMPVIKAAYKQLALIYHPDKTHGLEPTQRAHYAETFRSIQEAYDVLTNPSLKAAYDRELQRDGNQVDIERSTFHHAQRSRASKENGRPTVFITTPAAKAALRTRIELQLAQIKKDRLKRDYEDASMDIAAIQHTLSLWRDMADEREDDPVAHSYCLSQIQEYEHKLKVREAKHDAWLNDLASPKSAPSHKADCTTKQQQTYAQRQNAAASRAREAADQKVREEARNNRAGTTTIKHTSEPKSYLSASHKGVEAERQQLEEQIRRAEERKAEKARRNTLKKQHLEAKAAAVRADKLKQQRKIEEAAAKEAERIRKVRDKVKPTALLTKVGEDDTVTGWPIVHSPISTTTSSDTASETPCPERKSTGHIKCTACGEGHSSFRNWKECQSRAAQHEEKLELDDSGFFAIV